jgi:hypothetical protein
MPRMTALAVTAGVMLTIVLLAQEKTDLVLHRIEVYDGQGRYIQGLQPKDFRILEDGIVQKIYTFAEGNKPPVQVLKDGTTQPFSLETWPKQIERLKSTGSPENSYIIAYYPARNPNQGFRKIDVQIVSDAGRNFRVRHKAGYRLSK